jgi:hypothetical protein
MQKLGRSRRGYPRHRHGRQERIKRPQRRAQFLGGEFCAVGSVLYLTRPIPKRLNRTLQRGRCRAPCHRGRPEALRERSTSPILATSASPRRSVRRRPPRTRGGGRPCQHHEMSGCGEGSRGCSPGSSRKDADRRPVPPDCARGPRRSARPGLPPHAGRPYRARDSQTGKVQADLDHVARRARELSEVRAASRPASALTRVDFPTFGRPTTATSKPSRMRSAATAPHRPRARVPRPRPSRSRSPRAPRPTGTSSSAKSIVASSSAAARISDRRQPSASGRGAPQHAERLAALRLGLGLKKVGETLDLREVQPAVLHRAPRDGSPPRRPGPGRGRGEDRVHGRPAVRCSSSRRTPSSSWSASASRSGTRWRLWCPSGSGCGAGHRSSAGRTSRPAALPSGCRT